MNITHEKLKEGVYNFFVNFSDGDLLDYDSTTSEVKCALLEYSSELNTPDYEFEYETHHGPKISREIEGEVTTTYRTDKVEFYYTMKGNSEILLDINFSLVSGHYKFDKIELKYPGDLTEDFLDNTAKQIKVIIEHLFNQRGKLCVNCVWFNWKELTGFCDYQYRLNTFKKE
jgi:hypothetical protein